MRETTVANSYAESVFELADKHKLHDEFTRGFGAVQVLINEPVGQAFLASPKIDASGKKRLLQAVLGERVHPLFLNFLMVVVDKRRQRLLGQIAQQYYNLVDEAAGRMHVQVTVAREPSAELHQEIRTRLSSIFGKTVVPHITIEPRIIGGIVVRHEDRLIDGSLRRRLVALRHRLLERPVASNLR